MTAQNTYSLRTMGLDMPNGRSSRSGKDWLRHQICRDDTFVMNVWESYCTRSNSIEYTRLDNHIKINFWMGGRQTTVLDGFGQCDHDQPEVFITAGPPEMLKVDLCGRETEVVSVSLCLTREFFPTHMGLYPDQLPEPLRSIASPDTNPFAFHRFPMAPELDVAARSVISAPNAVRKDSLYLRAKATELMCLLINRMANGLDTGKYRQEVTRRRRTRLEQAREFIDEHFCEPLTVARICKQIGINRTSLASEFQENFGVSVYEYVRRQRLALAYELLKDETRNVSDVAAAVGYGHLCNFSTAFRSHFGCTPRQSRRDSAK